ncbi:hypothetical protein G6F31_016619 [Rhizopus arrhizus]|nr:hypothetical protein G6F31_016619 [Rhizopus arrhizus]
MTCTSGALPRLLQTSFTCSSGWPSCAATSWVSQSLLRPSGGDTRVSRCRPNAAAERSPRSTCMAWSSRIGGGGGRGIQPTTATLTRVASSRLARASVATQRAVDQRALTAPPPRRRSDSLRRAASAPVPLRRVPPGPACGAGG